MRRLQRVQQSIDLLYGMDGSVVVLSKSGGRQADNKDTSSKDSTCCHFERFVFRDRITALLFCFVAAKIAGIYYLCVMEWLRIDDLYRSWRTGIWLDNAGVRQTITRQASSAEISIPMDISAGMAMLPEE